MIRQQQPRLRGALWSALCVLAAASAVACGDSDSTGGAGTGGSATGGTNTGAGNTGGTNTGAGNTGGAGGAEPVCGNDAADAGEACDGTDLNGSDCASEGFDGGTLACLDDCSGFDTSGCTTITCGDNTIDGTDVCDGTDLAGADCISEGFDGGTLGCLDDCSALDVSGCIVFSCGNNTTEGMEACDGTDLGASTCQSEGFDGGTLACAASCTVFDTSACFVCGDNTVGGMETCDGTDLAGATCASQGFDGGTLGCAADCGGYDTSGCFACGDNVAEGTEICDGTDLAGATCVSEGFSAGTLACAAGCGAFDTTACTTCGDGTISGMETCDGANLNSQTCVTQGFAFGALGCSQSCGFSLSHCVNITTETEPNDDGAVAQATNDFSAVAANGPFTTDQLISAGITLGDDDVFAITNPSATGFALLSLETFGPTPGACPAPIDTVIDVRNAANTLLTTNDEAGINSCSLITNFVLSPGQTVYARVIDFGDNTAIPGYLLHIKIDPVVCGDGVPGLGEQCDDGNAVAGDGCSAGCLLEAATQEIEPNGTSAEADATGINITANTLLGGSIPVNGDLDRFKLTLATPQFVRFESFTSPGRCDGGVTTTLRLFDSVGTQIIADTSSLGISGCAALVFPLPAGTFYVQLEETGNNAVVPAYLLQVALLGDAGSETEPNEDQATANTNFGALSDVYVFGDHAVNTDSDFYALTVPAGASLRLEIIEGDRAVETCESNNIDSRITLYDAMGMQLVDDDDEGRGWCSMIDGTGTVALDAGAHNLAAGTYYVQVRASTFSQMGTAGQFSYRLVATVRQP